MVRWYVLLVGNYFLVSFKKSFVESGRGMGFVVGVAEEERERGRERCPILRLFHPPYHWRRDRRGRNPLRPLVLEQHVVTQSGSMVSHCVPYHWGAFRGPMARLLPRRVKSADRGRRPGLSHLPRRVYRLLDLGRVDPRARLSLPLEVPLGSVHVTKRG